MRNPKAEGGAEFVPELIHNRSGVGSHLAAVDLNHDGAVDIITSTNRGHIYLLEQVRPKAGPERKIGEFRMRLLNNTLLFLTRLAGRRAQTIGRCTVIKPAAISIPRSNRSIRRISANSRSPGLTTRVPRRFPRPRASKPSPAPRNRASQATPLMVGVFCIVYPYGRVVALEPETGKKIWEYESEYSPSGRGIAYWPGDATLPPQIVVGTMNGWSVHAECQDGQTDHYLWRQRAGESEGRCVG